VMVRHSITRYFPAPFKEYGTPWVEFIDSSVEQEEKRHHGKDREVHGKRIAEVLVDMAQSNALIERPLIVFNSPLFQVLSLRAQPERAPARGLCSTGTPVERAPLGIHCVIHDLFR